MREHLKPLEGMRGTFTGRVDKFGLKYSFRGPAQQTVLLKDIMALELNDKVVTDHLWLIVRKQLAALELKVGDVVIFDARVDTYEAGYKGYREDVYDAPIRTDYTLKNPSKVRKIAIEKTAPSPIEAWLKDKLGDL